MPIGRFSKCSVLCGLRASHFEENGKDFNHLFLIVVDIWMTCFIVRVHRKFLYTHRHACVCMLSPDNWKPSV